MFIIAKDVQPPIHIKISIPSFHINLPLSFPPVANWHVLLCIKMSRGHEVTGAVKLSCPVYDNDIRVQIVVKFQRIYAIISAAPLPRVHAVTNMS